MLNIHTCENQLSWCFVCNQVLTTAVLDKSTDRDARASLPAAFIHGCETSLKSNCNDLLINNDPWPNGAAQTAQCGLCSLPVWPPPVWLGYLFRLFLALNVNHLCESLLRTHSHDALKLFYRFAASLAFIHCENLMNSRVLNKPWRFEKQQVD